jgi:uncharacterized membrane protein
MATRLIACASCGMNKSRHQTVPVSFLTAGMDGLARRRKPELTADAPICHACLNQLRTDYVREEMEQDRGKLSALEQEVVKSLQDNQLVTDNLNREFEKGLKFSGRIADKVASFGGSWSFIGIFFGIMAIWIVVNTVVLLEQPFDPYPFILFNLVLSMMAAIQAPIIMMSQNRQEARDRLRAENDYQVNLKAELEIRTLTEKMDQLLHHQWVHLMEIQEMQTEMLTNLTPKNVKADRPAKQG